MKIFFHSSQSRKRAFALFWTLMFIGISLVTFGSIMYWVASSSKQAQRNNLFTTDEVAAEAATETVFAQMDRDFLYQSLNPDITAYNKLLPNMTNWPVHFVFSDTNGVTNQISIYEGTNSGVLQSLGSEFGGLQGFPQPVTITATATATNQAFSVPATVSQMINFAYIPAFQFAIFYNIDLEIDPGASMPIVGAVFSNGGIWSGTDNLNYYSAVESAETVSTGNNDPFCSGKSGNGGTSASHFHLSGYPLSNCNPLVIPIGAGDSSSTANNATNVTAILNIPPTGAGAPLDIAYVTTNLTYDFNAASLIVSNPASGKNLGLQVPTGSVFTVYFQDPANTAPAHWTQVTNDFYILTNWGGGVSRRINTNYVPSLIWTNSQPSLTATWTNGSPITTNRILYAGFSFLTNVMFYDYRESATCQVVQIDVAQFRTWVTNNAVNGGSNYNYSLTYDTGHGLNSIYVYNSVPLTPLQLPAVRLVNGSRLPNSTNTVGTSTYVTSGLTVVTPQPLYIWGHYNVQIDGHAALTGQTNTTYTYPAAVLADAITILSTSWSDTYVSGTGLSSRPAGATTINAGCLEGIVESANGNYSGGVENFMRLLENWSGVTLTYNGSIMVMFPSQYATNIWQNTGNYYNAPGRNWSFDTNFLVQSHLPPLTPQFRGVVRNTWSGY